MATTSTGAAETSDSNNNNNNSDTNNNNDNNNNDSTFECNICLESAAQPVITMCGHLYCWPCIYRWMDLHSNNPQCPVCKGAVAKDKLIPLYGRGKIDTDDPRSRIPEGIPNRPPGHHAEAPSHQPSPPFGFWPGPAPMATAQFGNISFAAGTGFFPSLFGLQFQAYPPNPQMRNNGTPNPEQDQQAVLSRLLFLLAVLVAFFLLFF